MKKEQLGSRGVLFEHELEVTKFNINSMTLLSESCENNDPRPFYQALMESVNVDPKQLSLNDVFSLSIYHRFSSLNGKPINLIWKCNGQMGQDSAGNLHSLKTVSESDDLDIVDFVDCGRNNHVAFGFEDFSVKKLPEKIDLPQGIAIPRSTLYPEYIELSKEPKLVKILPVVVWIEQGETIQEKIEFLEKQKDLELYNEAAQAAIKYEHGVRSRLRASCSKCGQDVERKVYIDQHSFFK